MSAKGGLAMINIGKFGLSEGTIQSLLLALKNHDTVKVSVLKNAARDKISVMAMAEEIVARLGIPVWHRTIGFTIILKRLRRAKVYK